MSDGKSLAFVSTRMSRPDTLKVSTVVRLIREDFERRMAELPARTDAYDRAASFGALLALMTTAHTLSWACLTYTAEAYDSLIALRDEIDAAIRKEWQMGGGQ